MKRFAKIFTLILGILILLLVTLAGILQTGWAKQQLKNLLVEQINTRLHPTLHIGALKGNLFTHLTFTEVLITTGEDTLLYLPQLSLRYRLWALWHNTIQIDSLDIVSPYVCLRKEPDGRWNFEPLLLVQPEAEDSIKKPFDMQIQVEQLSLRRGRICLRTGKPEIPDLLDEVNLVLSGFYSADSQALVLSRLQFHCPQPEFRLKKASFAFHRNGEEVVVERLRLETAGNQLFASARRGTGEAATSEVSGYIPTLNFQEISLFLPVLRFSARPRLEWQFQQREDSLHLHLRLKEDNREIALQGVLLLPDSSHQRAFPRYSLQGSFSHFRLRDWLPGGIPEVTGNGKFSLRGEGFSPEQARAELQAELYRLRIARRTVDSLKFRASYGQGDLNLRLRAQGEWGKARLAGSWPDMQHASQVEAQLAVQGLNLAPLLRTEKWESHLNGKVSYRGNLTSFPKLMGEVQARFQDSQLAQAPVDSAYLVASLDNGTTHLRLLRARAAGGSLQAQGTMRPDSAISLMLTGRVDSLSYILPYLPIKQTDVQGTFHASVQGNRDSLRTEVHFRLKELRFYPVQADTGFGELIWCWRGRRPFPSIRLQLQQLHLGSVPLDSLNLRARSRAASFVVEGKFWQGEEIAGDIAAHLRQDSVLQVDLPRFLLQLKNTRWEGEPTMHFSYHRHHFTFRDVRWKCASCTEAPALVELQGELGLQGKENVRLSVQNFRFAEMLPTSLSEQVPSGKLNLDLSVQGTFSSPEIQGKVHWQAEGKDTLGLHRLQGEFAYRQEGLNWEVQVDAAEHSLLHWYGHLPLVIHPAQHRFTWQRQQPMETHLKAEQFALENLNPFLGDKIRLGGRIQGELSWTNTLLRPQFAGSLRWEKGRFTLVEPNLDYRDISGEVHADSTRFVLDYLKLTRQKGQLLLTGFVEADSSIWKAHITRAMARADIRRFPLIQTTNFHLMLSSDLQARVSRDSSLLRGTVTVDQSVVYLPDFLEMIGEESRDNAGVPLLVQATRKVVPRKEEKLPGEIVQEYINTVFNSRLLRDFRGTILVRFPEDTWIKSPNMHLELRGELQLEKAPSSLHITGQIEANKGNVNFLGKNFRIYKGMLRFRGEPEVNPELVVEAEYEFRDSRQNLKTMKLVVSGRLNHFRMHFFLNGKAIDQTEAISYIMFGRSREDLLYGEAFSAGENAGSAGNQLLLDMAAGVISTELTRSLGKEFSIDMIEIKARDNWEQATFVVGKYLTNRLFVSYRRAIGSETDDDVAKETIRVEYEVVRNLFLQIVEGDAKTKGVDLIFKFER